MSVSTCWPSLRSSITAEGSGRENDRSGKSLPRFRTAERRKGLQPEDQAEEATAFLYFFSSNQRR